MEENTKDDALIVFSPVALYSDDDNTFSIKSGGTTYEVTTHFNKYGNETVFQQFKRLLLGIQLTTQ